MAECDDPCLDVARACLRSCGLLSCACTSKYFHVWAMITSILYVWACECGDVYDVDPWFPVFFITKPKHGLNQVQQSHGGKDCTNE